MTRAVPITQPQIRDVEEIAFDMIRDGQQEQAAKLLAICLAWKVSPEVIGAFSCNVDESGGLADVYDLDERRVGA